MAATSIIPFAFREQSSTTSKPCLSAEQVKTIGNLIYRIAICCRGQEQANQALHERLRFQYGVQTTQDLHPADFEAIKIDLEALLFLAEQHQDRRNHMDREFVEVVLRPPVSIRKIQARLRKDRH